MSAEMYEPYVPENTQDTHSTGQTSIEIPELLERAAHVEALFRDAYNWSDQTVQELFSRIAGSDSEVSGVLREQLGELYLESTSNAFLNDENRAVYRLIFDQFTMYTQTVDEMKDIVQKHDTTPEIVGEAYIIQRLLLAFEKLSVHHE